MSVTGDAEPHPRLSVRLILALPYDNARFGLALTGDNVGMTTTRRDRDNKAGSAEHARFIRNLLKNYPRRVREQSTDGLDALEQLSEIQAQLDERTAEVVLELRSQGYSWSQIGGAYGITREAAYRKWVGRAGVADTSPRKPGGQPGALR